jgi:hypothetical protein
MQNSPSATSNERFFRISVAPKRFDNCVTESEAIEPPELLWSIFFSFIYQIVRNLGTRLIKKVPSRSLQFQVPRQPETRNQQPETVSHPFTAPAESPRIIPR